MTSKKPNLEQDLAQLETLIKNMESGDTELDKALSNYEQGIKLVKQCQAALSEAEQKVKILNDNELQDFSDNGNHG